MKLFIDDKEIQAKGGETILEAARRADVFIPSLCWSEALGGTNCCRLCMVDVEEGQGFRLVAACAFPVKEGLRVRTDTQRVTAIRRSLLKLLYAQAPENPAILSLMERCGAAADQRIPEKEGQCVLCGLCTTACTKLGANAISTVNRGIFKEVDTPYSAPSETCVGCGACAQACPTDCIEVKDDEAGRIIWNTHFEWIRCEQCGAVITTKAHWAMSAEEGAAVLCPECRRRAATGALAQTYGE